MHREEELVGSLKTKGLLKRVLRYFIGLLAIISIAIYIGILLFGDNSLEVLIKLQNEEKNLKRGIKFYKQENAKLQKEYFELKELGPEQ